MRHRVYGKHLGRDKNQRTALFRSLIRSLILFESITTTEAKAKAIKGLVDKLISKSKKGTNSSIRVVQSALPQKEISERLIQEIAPRYKSRTSGFTQIVRIGSRLGDGAMMVRMSLVKKVADDKQKTVDSKPEKAKNKKIAKGKSK